MQARVADIGPRVPSAEERNLQRCWDDGLGSRVQRPHSRTPHEENKEEEEEEREPRQLVWNISYYNY